MRKRPKGSPGQAIVEMALITPVLIWLLLGIVDVGRMMQTVLTLQHSAREAVRLGITGATDYQVFARALDAAAGLDQTKLTVSVTPAGTRPSGSDLTVSVEYTYRTLAGLGVAATDVALTGALTARVE